MKNIDKKLFIHAAYEENIRLEEISGLLSILELHLKKQTDSTGKLRFCFNQIIKSTKQAIKTSEKIIKIADSMKKEA